MDSDEFSSAEDFYEKQEIEAILYSQVYHNYSQESDNLDDVSTDGEHLSTRKAFKEGTFDDSLAPDDGPIRDCKRDEDQSHLAGPKNRKSVKDAKYFKENGGDIQIVKEVVKIQHEDSDSDVVEVVSNNDKRANKRKISSSSDSETESGMPFWSRLDSGIINSDSKLNVNFHMNIAGSRKRNDSILSRTSSCLGEDDTSYIKIQDSEYDSLEQVLNTLPDDGWDIIHSDYKVKSLATKSPLRYHNMKCRNCNRLGHLSSVCPEAKKVKRCLLCSEIHAGKSKRNFCPETRCVNCLEQGHESKACPSLKELRHTFCRRCKTRGHKSKLCHELWRQWHITTEPLNTYPVVCENFVLNKPEYCAMCGLVGHFTHDCKNLQWWQLPASAPIIQAYNTTGKARDHKYYWGQPFNGKKSNKGYSGAKQYLINSENNLPSDFNHKRKKIKSLIETEDNLDGVEFKNIENLTSTNEMANSQVNFHSRCEFNGKTKKERKKEKLAKKLEERAAVAFENPDLNRSQIKRIIRKRKIKEMKERNLLNPSNGQIKPKRNRNRKNTSAKKLKLNTNNRCDMQNVTLANSSRNLTMRKQNKKNTTLKMVN